MIATGAALMLRDLVEAITSRWWLQVALAVLALGGGHAVLAFPLDVVRSFWLPRRFGLLHESFRRWLWDGAKARLIGAGLALVGAEIVYGLLRTTPWWWLWAGLLFFAGYALLAFVAPIWLVPLFYRLVPLGDPDLRDRLLGVAERAGVPVLGVWVADQSRKSRTANAAVVGLGRTRRILLFDTLIKEFPAAEVEAVLAHELAHQVHGDVRRGLLVQGLLTLAMFWVADFALTAAAPRLSLDGPADLAGLPLLGLVVFALGLVALPLANAWSRRVERQADDFAVRMSGSGSSFVDAMERLASLNLAERDPHFMEEFLLYSHPSIGRRVERARAMLRSPS